MNSGRYIQKMDGATRLVKSFCVYQSAITLDTKATGNTNILKLTA
jgi:hypothetical protein